jgi:GAF domain-containing protein
MRVLSEFAHTLARRYEISDVLYRLADHMVEILDLAGAGVSVGDEDGRLRPVTPINDLTRHLEAKEEEYQEGPCVDAFQDGRVVVEQIGDEQRGRWPRWSKEAEKLGVLNVAGIPMRIGDEVLGAVNLYRTDERPWTDAELTAAQVLTDMATSYLLGASELERHRRTTEQLQAALESRVVIEQAKGILAAERNIDVDKAFELLRAHARRRRVAVKVVAEAVVQLGLRPPP